LKSTRKAGWRVFLNLSGNQEFKAGENISIIMARKCRLESKEW